MFRRSLSVSALSMTAKSSSETGSRWSEGLIGMMLHWQENEDKGMETDCISKHPTKSFPCLHSPASTLYFLDLRFFLDFL
jgi:hypothetical protein